VEGRTPIKLYTFLQPFMCNKKGGREGGSERDAQRTLCFGPRGIGGERRRKERSERSPARLGIWILIWSKGEEKIAELRRQKRLHWRKGGKEKKKRENRTLGHRSSSAQFFFLFGGGGGGGGGRKRGRALNPGGIGVEVFCLSSSYISRGKKKRLHRSTPDNRSLSAKAWTNGGRGGGGGGKRGRALFTTVIPLSIHFLYFLGRGEGKDKLPND